MSLPTSSDTSVPATDPLPRPSVNPSRGPDNVSNADTSVEGEANAISVRDTSNDVPPDNTPTTAPRSAAGPPSPSPTDTPVASEAIIVEDTDGAPAVPSATPPRTSIRIASCKTAMRSKLKRISGAISGAGLAASGKKKTEVWVTQDRRHSSVRWNDHRGSLHRADGRCIRQCWTCTCCPVAGGGAPACNRAPATSIDSVAGRRGDARVGGSRSTGCTNHRANSGAGIGPAPSSAEAGPASDAIMQATPQAFDLEEFMDGFDRAAPVLARTATLPAPPSLSLETKVDRLFAMFDELREQLQARVDPVASQPVLSATEPHGDLDRNAVPIVGSTLAAAWTLPSAGNPADLPPPAIQQLRCSSFQPPPDAHEGRVLSPSSTPVGCTSTLQGTQHRRSARLVNRGLTIMHFRPLTEMEQLRRGSMNVDFSADFGAGAILPAATPRCDTYDDLLAAISGLTSFGDALFFDHVRRLTSRRKRFVLANGWNTR
ncbi:hypothetical protein V7S43_005131 [Phytophthora oleae]|uniref:Uncharacterized protein n=1 Tax=Phytophthora oleae TaxID=2107226 RepID=A0ABD3FS41_9STRA